MSKASEWAARQQAYQTERDRLRGPTPLIFNRSRLAGNSVSGMQAIVADDGSLMIRVFHSDTELMPKDAIALARWILETFE